MVKFELYHAIYDPNKPKDLVLEAWHTASLLASIKCFPSHNSNAQQPARYKLGIVGENILQEMYQPVLILVWSEA